MQRTLMCILLLVVASGSAAVAQSSPEGSVRGYVKDEQGAVLPGVSVTAIAEATTRPYVATSDGEGFYRLLNLPPGVYTIAGELQGFSRVVREGVVVRAGMNLGVDLTLTVGNVTETVEVKGETPMLEVSTPVQSVNISGEFQREVPLTGRKHWADFLKMAPGAVGSESPVYQGGFYYIHGADFESLAIQVDGVDIGSTQQASPVYIGMNADTVSDAHVKMGAFDAASPLGMGATISVVTQSGTNQFRGGAGIAYLPMQWIDNNTPGGTSTAIAVVQPDLSLGGPIQRDRAWFFGSYRHTYNDAGLNRTAAQLETLRALVPGFEPFNNETKADVYFAKATVQLTPKHQMYAMYNYDAVPSDTNGALSGGPFTKTILGGTAVAGRLTSVWNSMLTTRIAAGWNDKAFQIAAQVTDRPSRPVHRTVLSSSGRLMGSGTIAMLDSSSQSAEQPYSKLTFSADATYYKRGWGGSHEFQAGLYLQPKLHQETQVVLVNSGFSIEQHVLLDPANPAAGTQPFYRQIWDSDRYTNSLVDFSDNAFYIQDAWRPTGRLTVNAGVRFDRIERTDKLFDLEVQKSLEIGPRFGVNYMLSADQRSAVRASWVRMHDTPSINKASAGTNTLGFRELYDLDLNGSFETTFTTPGGARTQPNRIIDPDYHQQYVDEWTAGYRRQLRGQVTLDAAFIHREFRDRTTLVDQNGIYDGGVFRGYRNEALNEIYLLTNNQWNWLVYKGLEFQATKQTERLQVLASFTRVWRHIGGTWQPNDPASFIQPSAFPNDKGIGGVYSPTSVSQDGNSLSGTHQTFDNLGFIDYIVRASAAWRGPWDMVLATNYTLQAGVYSGPMITRIAAPDPQFGPPTVMLSNGRLVSNPLATVLRFANDTRGEGQLRNADVHYWNLRVGRDFRFGPRRLQAAVDLFNVTNAGRDQSFMSGANQSYSPNFKLTTSRQTPRAAQLTIRFMF